MESGLAAFSGCACIMLAALSVYYFWSTLKPASAV
jgi:hypothetical protein